MKRIDIILTAVIASNFALSVWGFLAMPENLPLHYDLDGNFTSTMPSWRLLLYPAASLLLWGVGAIGFAAVRRIWPGFDGDAHVRRNLLVMCLAIALTILCSTCVTMTGGRAHFFMFAEPVILLAGIAYAVLSGIMRKKQ